MLNLHTLTYLIAHLLPALVGFFALILYTHLLSPAEYGIYVIGVSIAGIISAMFFAWIRLSVTRYQARSPELDLRGEAVVAYALAVGALSCLAPAAILIARAHIGFGVAVASVFLSLAMTSFEINQEFKRAQLNPLRFTIVVVVRSLLGLLLGYGAIRLGGGGLGLLIAFGVSFVIANLLSLRNALATPLRVFAPPHLAQFIRYGLPFSLGALTISLHNSLDRLSVAYLVGASAAAYYGLAADIPRQVINLLASSVASAMFPITFRSLAQSGIAATRERLKDGAELLLALIAPAAVWLCLSADLLAKTLLGSQFQSEVAALLPLLAVGRMCGAVNQYYVQISFQLAEKPLLQVAHDSSLLVVNVLLILPLTLAFGVPGVAVAVLIAEALGILIGIRLSRSAFKLPFNGWGLARVFASTAIMALVTYAARLTTGETGPIALIAVAGSGGLAYAGSVLLFDVAGIRSSIASLALLRARTIRFPRQNAGSVPRRQP